MEERVYNPQKVDDLHALEGICGIYQIRNIINGHLYIGSSNNLFYRYKEHLKMLKANKHDNIHLQRAFNTYGKENMVFEIIEFNIDTSQQFIIEQYWIDKFYGENCYNINPIASKPPSSKGKKMPPRTEQARKNLSAAIRKRHREDPELRKRMSLVRIGKHMGAEHPNSKVVVCLETGEVFAGMNEAERKTGCSHDGISACCLGRNFEVNGFHFRYKEDYDKLSKEEIEEIIFTENSYKQVVCLETRKKYKKVSDAVVDTGIGRDAITDCCEHRYIEESLKWTHWVYYDEYKNMTEDEIKAKLNEHTSVFSRCVCLETGKHYKRISDAAKELNVSCSKISLVCQHKRQSTGGLHFLYEADYDKLSEEEIQAIIHEPPHKPKCPQKKCFCVETGKVFNSIKEASLEMNIDASNIIRVCKGRQKYAKGYTFKYLD